MEAYNELLENGNGGDFDRTNNSHEEEEKEPFPVPFLLLVAGYTLILMIDKVIFDNNIMHSHDESLLGPREFDLNNAQGSKLARASLTLRHSISEMQPGLVDPEVSKNLRASQILLENAVKKELSQSFRRSDHIAAAINRTTGGQE